MKGFPTTAITITRQMAGGGSYIGRRLAKRLGFVYLDRGVLHEAAGEPCCDEKKLKNRDETLSAICERIMKCGTPETVFMPPARLPVYDRDLFETEAAIITKTAISCNTVVVGRGGIHALRDHPNALHVFLHAPMEFRVQRLMQLFEISDRRRALIMIEESDSRREKFFRTMTGLAWTDARNYHLCMDISRTGVKEAEEGIVRLVGIKEKD